MALLRLQLFRGNKRTQEKGVKFIRYHHTECYRNTDISTAAFILSFEHIQELLVASLLLALSIYWFLVYCFTTVNFTVFVETNLV